MQLYRRTHGLPASARGTCLALGNFDGLHQGHRAVIAHAAQQAKRLNVPLAAMTFEPNPRRLFNPELPPLKLYPVAEKLRLLQEAGVEIVYMLRFTKEFSQMTAQQFIHSLLNEQLEIAHLVTGRGFQFGYKRSGDAETLAQARFGYSPIAPFIIDGEPCSSTRIRQALRDGNPQKAAELLGRPYTMKSRVLHGEKRGRQWGFPTANLAPAHLFTPAYGIYAVTLTQPNGTCYNGVANYGIRPMYPTKRPLLEVHCFDAEPDLYGQKVEVAFHHYLRDEKKFANEQDLITQIHLDEANARAWFA